MRKPSLRRVGALVMVLAMSVMSACTPVPDGGFSTPGADLPPLRPGDVVRARPWSFTQDPINRTPAGGVGVHQVLYRSTSAGGQPVGVTGTVLVPTRPWAGAGSRPLVTLGVGTRGVGDACAPSKSLAEGIDYEGGLIVKLLGQGWAVAVSDMEGLGTPGEHTYMVGRSQGMALLDMARAAIRLPASGLAADAPVGVLGYSQGGASAGWAAQLATSYAPDLRVVGVAAAGVPADLTAVASGNDGGPFVGLVLLAAVGLDAAYPELDLDSYMNDRGRALLGRARDLCLMSVDGFGTLVSVAGSTTDSYSNGVNPLTTPTWRARLAENRLGGMTPTVPVLLQHGLLDEIIPFQQAADLRHTWCAAGANVTWRVFPFVEHATGALASADPAMAFLSDRFRGRPVAGNCGDPNPFPA